MKASPNGTPGLLALQGFCACGGIWPLRILDLAYQAASPAAVGINRVSLRIAPIFQTTIKLETHRIQLKVVDSICRKPQLHASDTTASTEQHLALRMKV
jgi:hypothetical protein